MQAMQAQMMRQARDKTQNEMVVDTRSVTPFLPGAMEAFFYLTTSLPHYLTTSLPHYLTTSLPPLPPRPTRSLRCSS